jgi:hypothetical protein
MAQPQDLSELSEDELTGLIDEATSMRQSKRDSRERETAVGADGARGQDVEDPNHGAITAPTPREVREKGPAHGAT